MYGAELLRQRPAQGAQFRVEHAHLKRRLGHPVSLEPGQCGCDSVGAQPIVRREGGNEEAAQYIHRGVGVLGGVQRIDRGDTFSPALRLVGDHTQEQGFALRLGAE